MSKTTADLRMRDPYILESSPEHFVLFGTTDENLWAGPATGFDCYTSTDLVNWEGPFEAFRPASDFWGDTQFWAPEVHQYQGRFFLIATFASSIGAPQFRGIAVLVSDSPIGPFAPWSDGPITPAEIPCLDGTLFIDDDAEPWLIFSRGAEGVPGGAPGVADSEMLALRLTADLRGAHGEAHVLFRASAATWAKPLWFPEGVEPPEELNLAEDPLFTDGPCVIRSSAGGLLMTWSSFGDEGYAIGVAHSPSGSILGPWIQRDEPLWARNGGHGMILRTSSGSDLLVFHWPNDTPNERVRIVPVTVRGDDIRLA